MLQKQSYQKFNFKYIRKYFQNCVWLSYLFPFQKRFAKTGEFRPSKAGPCLEFPIGAKMAFLSTLKFFVRFNFNF